MSSKNQKRDQLRRLIDGFIVEKGLTVAARTNQYAGRDDKPLIGQASAALLTSTIMESGIFDEEPKRLPLLPPIATGGYVKPDPSISATLDRVNGAIRGDANYELVQQVRKLNEAYSTIEKQRETISALCAIISGSGS